MTHTIMEELHSIQPAPLGALTVWLALGAFAIALQSPGVRIRRASGATATIAVATPDSATLLADHIATFLARYNPDSSIRSRIASAIVHESARTHLDANLLVGIVLVEDPDLKPHARNPNSGALGLMQVMPMHAGRYGCGSSNLRQIESNICHGSRLLADLMKEANGSRRKALLHYNGCRKGTVTHNCFSYPEAVVRHARSSRRYVETQYALAAQQ